MTPASPRPLVLGVLNVTPDSFSDGGDFFAIDDAIARGHELLRQGADVIDIGGESTRPGATPVPGEEERRRILPVIAALAAAGARVSVDTIHADTARAAVAAGASLINDVSGGLADPQMARVAADTGATYLIGHWRGIPDPGHGRSGYHDVVAEVRGELARLADAAVSAGVEPDRVVIDPGLGFDKTAAQGWALLRGLPSLATLGFPVLIGVSRKRMLGELLAAGPGAASEHRVADRDLATAVVSALAAERGAWGVRVHDVTGTVQALAVAEAWGGPVGAHAADDAPRSRTGADRLTLTGLEVFAYHGVHDVERADGQPFVIDVDLEVPLAAAAADDDLRRTVHYGDLAAAVVRAVERDPVDLIETVAERVAAVALGFDGVRSARITVHKPQAPIGHPFADVSVTIERRGGA